MVTGTRRSASLQHWVAAQGRDRVGQADARPGRAPRWCRPLHRRRALMVIIAIMTFLGSLTVGGVDLVRTAAADWTSSIVREATIQVRPGRAATWLPTSPAPPRCLRFPGVADVAPYTARRRGGCSSPGSAPASAPRTCRSPPHRGEAPRRRPAHRMEAFRRALAEVPTASLDDHRQWFDRLRAMARAVIVVGLVIVALMIAATGLSSSSRHGGGGDQPTGGRGAAFRRRARCLHRPSSSDTFSGWR